MKKNLRMVSVLLAVVLVMGVFVAPVAAGQGNGIRGSAAPSLMTEVEIAAYWAEMRRVAEASVTPEQIAEAYRIMEETEQFFANLTPETLWEAYLRENPEVVRMSADKLSAIKLEVQGLFERLTVGDTMLSPKNIAPHLVPPHPIPPDTLLAYTRHFSIRDGLGIIGRIAIEVIGSSAATDAAAAFPGNVAKQDAYRHYLWNFRAVRSLAVSLTQDGRVRSTRIYTANRELATNILRWNIDLVVAAPSATQLATALYLRQAMFFNRTFAQWDIVFTGVANGGEDLMDLWNNEKGSQDGVVGLDTPLVLFNNRWRDNTVIKSSGTSDVTPMRRQIIWIARWYVPVR